MVPLLLLLLLHETLEDQVCVNISVASITTTVPYGTITDDHVNAVKCQVNGTPCVIICKTNNNNITWPSGTSFCLDTNVEKDGDKFVYTMKHYGTCTLYLCKGDVIRPLMQTLGSNYTYQKAIVLVLYIKDTCAHLFRIDNNVKKVFIRVERDIIHNIMRICQTMNLTALSLSMYNYTALSSTSPWIQTEAPQLLSQPETFVPEVWLPVTGLHNIPNEKRIIGLVSYTSPNQFQFEQEQILSMVIRIEELGEQYLHDLTTPIKMIFRIGSDIKEDNDSSIVCQYFDEDDFEWKSDGCETVIKQTNVTCNCNHATPFAVLLIRDQPISEVHWKILSYISYVGCGLSAFFTSLSIVIYVFIRNPQMEFSISIHVSLSGALFLLNTSFMLTEWGSTVKADWVCVLIASLMHYSLLSCFTWMAIEALHLYLLLIKVFNTYYKHYLAKLSLAGWGIPGVIVAVSLAVKDFKQLYGLTEISMANSNETSAICWITDDTFFYSLNLVYFTLVFIFNTSILLTVTCSICKIKQTFRSKPKAWGDPERLRASCRSALTVLGLTCLMGTTWGLAFLGSGYVNYPILYLFCIFNSLQGFFIFLWICLSVDKQRRKDMADRQVSSQVKSSDMKSD